MEGQNLLNFMNNVLISVLEKEGLIGLKQHESK